jgi:hypothetical protein
MADLLALQPNMDIKLHIVAPTGRRDKVFQELRRPVFSLLERAPLAESCTFLSYESVRMPRLPSPWSRRQRCQCHTNSGALCRPNLRLTY